MAQWITQQKFIAQTGLDYGAVRCWRKAGLIPAIKMRGKWMLDIEAFNDDLRMKATAKTRIRIRTLPVSDKKYRSFDNYVKAAEQRIRDKARQEKQGLN